METIKNKIAAMEERNREINTRNVLILAMSVLSLDRETARPTEYRYEYEHAGKKYVFFSGSQLVPGSKYIASVLDAEGKKIDRIIVINTKETLKEAETKEGKSFGVSPYDYYRKGLVDYLSNSPSEHKDETSLTNSYSKMDTEGLFLSINKDEKNLEPDQYLWSIAQAIKGEDPGKYINLYVDTQGGDRNAIVEINAVIDLLRNRDVSVKKRIAIDFNKENSVQYIKEVDEQYRTYQLFSAMQTFERFGMGNELVDYFEDNKSELIETVQTLTESIQLCDMNTFDEGIRRLNKLTQEEATSTDTRLNIVEEDIYQGYRNILENILSGKRIIFEEIRWCQEKGYLQQALTLIESKALKEFYCSEVFYWEPDELVAEVKENGVNVNTDISQAQALSLSKSRWDDLTINSLVQWCFNCLVKEDYNKRHLGDTKYFVDEENKSAYIDLEDLEIERIPNRLPADPHNILIKWNKGKDKKPYEGKVTYLFDSKNRDLIKFLRLHMALKNQRNTINHASTDERKRCSYDAIKRGIEMYLILAEELLEGKDTVRECPKEDVNYSENKSDKKTKKSKAKIAVDKTIYTFNTTGISGSKKSLRGKLEENGKVAVLPNVEMKQALTSDEMKKAVEDKRSFKVQVIEKAAAQGEVLVREKA